MAWAIIMAVGVYCKWRKPRGPDLHKKRLTHSPTTTGGRPMPRLTMLTAIFRPGKEEIARKTPRGTPINTLIKVAIPDTFRVRTVILNTSGSPSISRKNALTIPCQINSTVTSTNQAYMLILTYR